MMLDTYVEAEYECVEVVDGELILALTAVQSEEPMDAFEDHEAMRVLIAEEI